MPHKRTEIKEGLLLILREAVKELTFDVRQDVQGQVNAGQNTPFYDQPIRRPTELYGRPIFALQIPSEQAEDWGEVLAKESRSFDLVITVTLYNPAHDANGGTIGPDYLAEIGVLLESILLTARPPLPSINLVEFEGYTYEFLEEGTEQEILNGTWQFKMTYSLERGHGA